MLKNKKKEKKSNKKKELILTVVALVSLVIITLGTTYAFFHYAKEGTTENAITTGTLTFLYTEVDKIGKGISISDAFPMSDDIGKNQTGDNKVFNFKITSTTTSKNSIPYEITARKDSDSNLDESVVKMYLTKVEGDNEEEVLLKNYNQLNQTDKVEATKHIEKTLYKDKVPANQEGYEQSYRLRMWIDDKTDFSQTEEGEYPYNNQTFTVTVNVYAEGKVITEEDKELASNVGIKTVSVGGETLSKVEDESLGYDYETSLDEGTTETEIQVETENPYAKVKIEKVDSLAYQSSSNVKKLSTSNQVQLNPGDNYFKVTVTSENEEEIHEYKIKITVAIGKVLLSEEIFRVYTDIQENPTLTTTSEKANENGLYKSNATSSGEYTYYFRGEVENNYVSFAGQIWRIIRINEDGSIRMIMQNGIDNQKYIFNVNLNMYYSNNNNKQNAKKTIDEWYETNITAQGLDNKVVEAEYCEQAKVSYDSRYPGMQYYISYTPNFNCETDVNGKGILKLKVGLITYDEVVFAGGYYNKSNNTFYLYNNANFWTMSPADNSYGVWCAVPTTSFNPGASTNSEPLRPVINLASDTKVLGLGTEQEPWVVQ